MTHSYWLLALLLLPVLFDVFGEVVVGGLGFLAGSVTRRLRSEDGVQTLRLIWAGAAACAGLGWKHAGLTDPLAVAVLIVIPVAVALALAATWVWFEG